MPGGSGTDIQLELESRLIGSPSSLIIFFVKIPTLSLCSLTKSEPRRSDHDPNRLTRAIPVSHERTFSSSMVAGARSLKI
jgi:hypothetical protein